MDIEILSLESPLSLDATLEQDAEFLDTDAEHQHDESVTSVGIEVADAAMDITKLEAWLRNFGAPEARISSGQGYSSTRSGTDERHGSKACT